MTFATKTLTTITSPLNKPIVEVLGNRAAAKVTDRIDSIDPHIRQLECMAYSPSFSAETISNLTHLWITDIEAGMTFPRSLEHLIVWGYTGRHPLPKVRNIYIKLGCEPSIQSSQRFRHCIILVSSCPSGKPRKNGYKVRKQRTIEAFGSTYRYYERVPIKSTETIRTNLDELWRINRAATNAETRRRTEERRLRETDSHGLFLFHLEQIEADIIRHARKGNLGDFCVSIYTPKGYAVGEALALERLPYCEFSEHMGRVLIKVRRAVEPGCPSNREPQGLCAEVRRAVEPGCPSNREPQGLCAEVRRTVEPGCPSNRGLCAEVQKLEPPVPA